MIQGRQERIDYQLEQWVQGNSIHNDVDNECCPDFSCCNEIVTPQEEKDQFARMSKAGHNLNGLLGTFLGRALDAYYKKKNKKKPDVHICDGINEKKITKCYGTDRYNYR